MTSVSADVISRKDLKNYAVSLSQLIMKPDLLRP